MREWGYMKLKHDQVSRGQVSPGEWPLLKNQVIVRGHCSRVGERRIDEMENVQSYKKRETKRKKEVKHILYFAHRDEDVVGSVLPPFWVSPCS